MRKHVYAKQGMRQVYIGTVTTQEEMDALLGGLRSTHTVITFPLTQDSVLLVGTRKR